MPHRRCAHAAWARRSWIRSRRACASAASALAGSSASSCFRAASASAARPAASSASARVRSCWKRIGRSHGGALHGGLGLAKGRRCEFAGREIRSTAAATDAWRPADVRPLAPRSPTGRGRRRDSWSATDTAPRATLPLPRRRPGSARLPPRPTAPADAADRHSASDAAQTIACAPARGVEGEDRRGRGSTRRRARAVCRRGGRRQVRRRLRRTDSRGRRWQRYAAPSRRDVPRSADAPCRQGPARHPRCATAPADGRLAPVAWRHAARTTRAATTGRPPVPPQRTPQSRP